MAPLVSVIVPVYNVSPYLRQCMDSIVNQTLKDIEIICVDDGSTDDSLAILQEYATRDSRITILQQKNKGAGVARNLGMTKAAGKYLSFLDSDDFFDTNLLEDAYIACDKDNSDFVIYNTFDYNNETKSTVHHISVSPKNTRKNPFCYADIAPGIMDGIVRHVPWNKLFRKSFIITNNLIFSSTKYSNDSAFSIAASYLAHKITYLENAYVYYRRNIQTNLQSSSHKDWKYIIQISKDLLYYLVNSDNFGIIKQDIQNIILNWIISSFHKFYINNEFENIKQMSLYLYNEGFELFNLKNIPSKYIYNGYVYKMYNDITRGKEITFKRNKYAYIISTILFRLYYNPKYTINMLRYLNIRNLFKFLKSNIK